MSQNISLLGATYPNVPSVLLPKSGGGQASFTDVTDTTAVASDVAQGKYFYTAAGVRTAGTSSGGGGSSDVQVGTATASTATSQGLIFYGLSGEPTSFVIIYGNQTAVSPSTNPIIVAVVYDGSNLHAQTITNTSNAQVSYNNSDISMSYQSGTLIITSESLYFNDSNYSSYGIVYTYGGTSANIDTADVQVGSGATSITFTGLEDEPEYWSCIFKSNFSTSSGYQRVIAVANDGTNTFGLDMDSGAHFAQAWTASYSNGSLTITSSGTNNGGYFHQPGYYQLTYAVSGDQSLQTKTATPTASDQNITADTGYSGLKKVVVEGVECENLIAANIKNGVTVKVGTATDDDSVTSVTGSYSAGGAGGTVDSKTASLSAAGNSISFTGLSGSPIAWFIRCTTQLSSSGSTTYYYVADMRYNGTNTQGTLFRIGSTRRIQNQTTGFSYTYSNGTLTISTSATSAGATPGYFYNGTYELVYVY